MEFEPKREKKGNKKILLNLDYPHEPTLHKQARSQMTKSPCGDANPITQKRRDGVQGEEEKEGGGGGGLSLSARCGARTTTTTTQILRERARAPSARNQWT